jgi:hypothetical protein
VPGVKYALTPVIAPAGRDAGRGPRESRVVRGATSLAVTPFRRSLSLSSTTPSTTAFAPPSMSSPEDAGSSKRRRLNGDGVVKAERVAAAASGTAPSTSNGARDSSSTVRPSPAPNGRARERSSSHINGHERPEEEEDDEGSAPPVAKRPKKEEPVERKLADVVKHEPAAAAGDDSDADPDGPIDDGDGLMADLSAEARERLAMRDADGYVGSLLLSGGVPTTDRLTGAFGSSPSFLRRTQLPARRHRPCPAQELPDLRLCRVLPGSLPQHDPRAALMPRAGRRCCRRLTTPPALRPAIQGPNGSGKSTVVNAIAIGLGWSPKVRAPAQAHSFARSG